MTMRRRRLSRATAGVPLRKSFSTWRAAGWGRQPSERARRPAVRLRGLGAAHRRDDRPLLVPAALVLAAAARAHLLAGGADADVGLSAALYRRELRVLRPCRRHLHRRGAAVGHPVPRPARLLGIVSRGDVV